jgi:hypothetical protein
MHLTMIVSCFILGLFSRTAAVDPSHDFQFLNPIGDPSAEATLLKYYYNNESITFKEINYFQPQCLLRDDRSKQVCFGYKSGTSYGIASGTIKNVHLITNLPYIYSLGQNVGTLLNMIDVVFTLREDLVIPYRTLLRFKVIFYEGKYMNKIFL